MTNAGGINSLACMATMSSIGEKVGAEGLKIAVVLGDDVLNSKDKITTDQCPDPTSITSMNAYLGYPIPPFFSFFFHPLKIRMHD